jgi:hypothetical protein
MSKLAWRKIAHAKLAELLNGAAVDDSHAVGESTVYHFNHEGRECVAVSLPEGRAVLIEIGSDANPRRRHIDNDPLT